MSGYIIFGDNRVVKCTTIKLFVIGVLCTIAMADLPADVNTSYVELISGGFTSTNRVSIAVGDHTFYKDIPNCPATAGLYVVALFGNKVLFDEFYHTYQLEGASEGLARDIEALPEGALVLVAAKDEPISFFDQRGQDALLSIGAFIGLLNQPYRTSYLCVGRKGMQPGEAIEKIGMDEQRYRGEYAGTHIDLVFPEVTEPNVSVETGIHEGLYIGRTEVIYYIPNGFDPNTAQYVFGIHGAGDWHRPGAMHRIHQFKDIADRENLVIVAPAFDAILNWTPVRPDDFDEHGNFKDRRIIKNRYLWDFVGLLNHWHGDRSDQKLIEIFEFFNQHVMCRERFHLYGHSGGAQFVVRFAMFYPELLDKVAASSAGTFAFPRYDIDYPHGLKMDNLRQNFPVITDFSGIALGQRDLDQKLLAMLDLNLILTVGEYETAPDHPELSWQGLSTLDKAFNFYDAMEQKDHMFKAIGSRDPNSPFLFELHVLPETGHDSRASGYAVGRLMFPTKPGDITADGRIDFMDIRTFTDQWLAKGLVLPADIVPQPIGDRVVDFKDFALIARNWSK